jgi:hypothetical protein
MECVNSKSEKFLPWGNDIDGLLIYDQTGYMSLQMVNCSETPIDPNNAYHSYYGEFEVDVTNMILTHKIYYSVRPEFGGTVQERSFSLMNKILTLKSPPMQIRESEELQSIITTWVKL